MDLEEARREALREYVRSNGGHAKVVGKYGLTPSQASYLSQLVTAGSSASFGEKSAANWEQRLKMPVGTLVQPNLANVERAPVMRRVPVISWVQAGMWGDVVDNFHPGEADEWAAAVNSMPSKHAFALRVVGDSMTNPLPTGRTFPEGTIIIVDPGRAAGPGDFVIAKDVQTQQATFKQLTTDGGRWFLRPLNPAYPTIEIDDPDMRVIGRVIEYQMSGKL